MQYSNLSRENLIGLPKAKKKKKEKHTMKSKTTKAKKVTTELVWVDVALTSSPSDALAYGFMSPDLVPIINSLLNRSSHSIVMNGTCFEHHLASVKWPRYKEELLRKTTKWEEQS